MLIIFLTFPGDMHWKITNSKAKMTRNSHMHKNFKQDTYYINFVPQQKLFSSFFVGTVTRGKLLEENFKSLGVHVCWKTIISILGMTETINRKLYYTVSHAQHAFWTIKIFFIIRNPLFALHLLPGFKLIEISFFQ